MTRGRSSTPQGGNARPSGRGRQPVALATAAISIADFVPSRNELNICAFMPPRLRVLGSQPVVVPHRVRRRGVVRGEILRSLPRGDHLEARTRAPSRPSRRSAPAGRRTRASRRCPPPLALRASSGPASASASTFTITTCLRAPAAREHVTDARRRASRRVDHDVDRRRGDERAGVLADVRRAALARVRERAGADALRRESDARERGACTRGIEIRHPGEMDAGRASAPATGTSSRTCPRRSGRREAARRPRRAWRACDGGSRRFSWFGSTSPARPPRSTRRASPARRPSCRSGCRSASPS